MKRSYLERRLLDTIPVCSHAATRRGCVTEIALDLANAMVSSK